MSLLEYYTKKLEKLNLPALAPHIKFLREECLEMKSSKDEDWEKAITEARKLKKYLVLFETDDEAFSNSHELVHLSEIEAEDSQGEHSVDDVQLAAFDCVRGRDFTILLEMTVAIAQLMALHREREAGIAKCVSCSEMIPKANADADKLLAEILSAHVPVFVEATKLFPNANLNNDYVMMRIIFKVLEQLDAMNGFPENMHEAHARQKMTQRALLGHLETHETLLNHYQEATDEEDPELPPLGQVAKTEFVN